jgi:hypothetical protein
MRVERVILEHHRDVAILGLDAVDHAAIDRDRARGDLFEPRDHPQQGRFPAARRPDDNHQLAIRDIATDAVHDFALAIGFLDVVEGQRRHVRRVLRIVAETAFADARLGFAEPVSFQQCDETAAVGVAYICGDRHFPL